MMQLICYLFPSVIAVWVTEIVRKKKFEIKEWFYYFCLYVISINLFISFLLTTMFNGATIYLSLAHFTHSLIVKYLGISILLSVILPIVFTIVAYNFQFQLVVGKFNRRDVRKKKYVKKSKKEKKN